VRILKTIRRSAAPGSQLLIVEADVGEGEGPSWGKIIDVIMMTLFAGRQRTRAEFATIFAAAGYRMADAVPALDGSMIYVGEPV
jgi:hypothetical protein